MEDYENKGKSLTGKVAEPLILELFDKQTNVPTKDIREKVTELHRSRGGLPPTSEKSFPVTAGLDNLKLLKKPKQVDNPVGMEKRIHDLLDNAGLRKKDAPGQEWFFTNPRQVKRFYELMQPTV